VHDLRAEYVGPEALHVGMHVEVRRGLPVEEADRIAHEVEGRVHQKLSPGICVIHVDPAEPESTP
jgi:divalent metal cation (Fe/Co/Zn/Cd) transporter